MKKSIAMSLTVGTLLVASVAFAQTDTMMHKDSAAMSGGSMMMHPPAPMILIVNSDGTGRLRGVVSAVSSTSLTVAAWGGPWIVSATSNTKTLGTNALSEIKVGDYVGAMGLVSEDAPSMTATIIRDWTTKHDAMMH